MLELLMTSASLRLVAGVMDILPDWFVGIHEFVPTLWGSTFDVANQFNQFAMLLAWSIIVFLGIVVAGKAAVVFMVLMERKVLAWVTQRKGPNRVGPFGLLQTIADGVKLLFKEDVMTPGQDKLLFTLGPAIFIFPVFVLYAFVPFTDYLFALDIPVGALAVFALSSISVLGMVLAGWASNNKYSLIGGMRSAAQAISYEIPLVLAVLTVVLFTGSMNMKDIVEAQQGPFGALSWYFIYLTPISFMIFLISSIAEVNRIPFDLPEAESELVSGYNTEYSGMKFAMFFLAEYAALFVMSALTVTFFFGGYSSPLAGIQLGDFAFGSTIVGTLFTGAAEGGGLNIVGLLSQFEMITWFLLKTYIFIFLAMWLRGTLPRLKPDQLMGFSWKFLIPLSLINVFMVAFQRFWAHPSQLAAFGDNLIFFAIWAVVLFGGVIGFFVFSSRMLNNKLNERLSGV